MRARQTEELRTQQRRHELRKLSWQPANLVATEQRPSTAERCAGETGQLRSNHSPTSCFGRDAGQNRTIFAGSFLPRAFGGGFFSALNTIAAATDTTNGGRQRTSAAPP